MLPVVYELAIFAAENAALIVGKLRQKWLYGMFSIILGRNTGCKQKPEIPWK